MAAKSKQRLSIHEIKTKEPANEMNKCLSLMHPIIGRNGVALRSNSPVFAFRTCGPFTIKGYDPDFC